MVKGDGDVFGYLDFRKYLSDYYAEKKRTTRTFSYRWFARRAGLRAPNHLKRVIDGERNLAAETTLRYAEALDLEGDAASYFCELVRFGQAKSQKEKSAAYRRLSEYQGYRRAQPLDAQHDRYHSEWYISAIREMLPRSDFRGDPKWVAKQLIPPIAEADAKGALDVLEELGMISRAPDGSITRADQVVSTGPETAGMHVGHYHGVMMKKAMESIDIVPRGERDISGVTLCLPEKAIPLLKERIRAFRREIIAMEAAEGDGDRVVQLAIQLFPLTTGKGDES
ncbi:MAG: hypothetical protein DRJ42_04520 [Deltaproteobacteria bacterium]|nr:MAG: hypothetical protein DRJ42_04520 [Deltaproteobacteria bacterium]